MKIVGYRTKYFDQILELNKSLVDNWFKFQGKNVKKSKWDHLTSKERYLHGGPWNDPITLRIHLEAMMRIGSIDLAIDSSDNVLGMVESHVFNNYLHIDWMMTAPVRQNRGIGSVLINNLRTKSKKSKLNAIRTEPEDGIDGFYHKNGFQHKPPDYLRYSIKSEEQKNTTSWEEFKPKDITNKKIIGEANNTKAYLSLLLETNIKYCELFEEPYPLKSFEVNGTIIYVRKIPALKKKSSLFYTDKEFELESLSNHLTERDIFYFTSNGKLNTSWDLVKVIKRLILSPL